MAVGFAGVRPLPAPKPKPGEAPPKGKPKVQMGPLELKSLAQGNSAFDVGSTSRKANGTQDIDGNLAAANQQNMRVDSVIVSCHANRLEEGGGKAALSEDRAISVLSYLTSKAMDSKILLWEGKGAREPVPVTNLCSGSASLAGAARFCAITLPRGGRMSA